jgi:hypothetical protein
MSVGTNVGDIALWEVGTRERLVSRNFKVWDLSACSMPFQVFFLIFCLYMMLLIKICDEYVDFRKLAVTEEKTNCDIFRLLLSKIQVFLLTV